MAASIHPSVGNEVASTKPDLASGTLTCHGNADPVTVSVVAQSNQHHACRCSKCLKLDGALFFIVAVVARDKVGVTGHEKKLRGVDPAATIQRHACTGCSAHMFGRIENEDHPFYRLDFIHTELSKEPGWSAPGFAAFVSSIIEQGAEFEEMGAVRARLHEVGRKPYDCLSPPLMDAIGTHVFKSRERLAA